MSEKKLFIFNSGSTSTKVAIYADDKCLFSTTLRHSAEDIAKFKDISEQYGFRKQAILDLLEKQGFDLKNFTAIVARGGTVKAAPGGVYEINAQFVEDANSGRFGKHATNVGCRIAYDLGQEYAIPALTVDPPTSDELCDEARFSGIPQIWRFSSFHALNQKAICRKLAQDLGKTPEDLDAIVVHLGGGISVGAHQHGRVIDVNNALDGDGPFSPERAGSLPVGDLIDLCFSGKHDRNEMRKLVSGKGGLVAYLGTTDGQELEKRIAAGDDKARKTIEAMAYQVAKEIGSAACVLSGKVEAIAFTGGLANWSRLVTLIKDRVEFIAPVRLYPGEDEIGSLAAGALRVLRGDEKAKAYS
jgi:butyrate kinase